MGSENRSRSRGQAPNYEDHEWEAQRANFYHCYIVEKRTLDEATICMAQRHGFCASKRQWERRAIYWGFRKYVRQDIRRQQQEENQPGQHKDRNQKRWERRERARSVGSTTSAHSGADATSPQRRGRARSSVTGASLSLVTSNDQPADDNGFLHPEQAVYSSDISSGEYENPESLLSVRYDVELPETSRQALRTSGPPDHFPLEAVRHEPDNADSPFQISIDYNQRGEPVDRSGQTGVPEIKLWADGEFSGTIPMDPSPSSDHPFQMPSSDPISQSQSGMSGNMTFYQQNPGSFDGASSLSNGGVQTAFNSQYDPAVDSPWLPGIPNQSLDQGQQYEMSVYSGNASPSQPISQPSGMPNGFRNLGNYNGPASCIPVPYEPAPLEQSTQTLTIDPHLIQANDFRDPTNSQDPHRLETDFILRLGDYTKSVKKIVKSFAFRNVPSSELEKLKSDLNTQRITFSDEMRVILENLVKSLQRTQKDIDHTNKMRQEKALLRERLSQQTTMTEFYRQMLRAKGIDPDAEIRMLADYQGQSSLEQSDMFRDIDM